MKKHSFTFLASLTLLSNTYGQESKRSFTTYGDSAYINLLIEQADALPADILADSAIKLYTQAALRSEKTGYAYGIVYAYSKISSYQYNKNKNYTVGLQAAESAFPYLKKLEERDRYLIPTVFNLKGINLYKMALYDSAIYNYKLALSAMDRLHIRLPNLRSQILNNIGSVFATLEQLPTGLSYYHKALEVPDLDPLQLANAYTNLGATYANLVGDMDSATYWWSRAITIYRDMKLYDKLQYIYANMSIGWQSPAHEDLDKAARYLDSAVMANPTDAYTHFLVLRAAAWLAYSQGHYPEAIHYGNRLIAISQANGNMLTQSQAYWLLSYSYAFLGDKEQTKAYQLMYQELNDRINYEDVRRSINALEIKYRIVEKEKALAESQAQTYRQRNWLYLSGVSLLLLVTLSLGYIRNFRQRRRLDAEKIHSLEQRNRLEELNIRMEAEEEERIRISGELHDSLGVLISAAKLNNTLLKKNIGSERQRLEAICKDGAGLLEDIHQEMRSIAHNLKPEYYLSHKSLGDALKEIAARLESDDFRISISEFGPSS